MNPALRELEREIGASKISCDPVELESYGRDWTRAWKANPSAVCFPESTEDVASIVQWARKYSIPIVPSGGRTGLSGGAVAANREVVVSMSRMNQIKSLNTVDRLVTCGAGVPTEILQKSVDEAGYFFPVDFASRGSSQIGGNIATNAGGTKVIRYGLMREWVAGLVVVTGTGEILNLSKSLKKDNSGYDLKQIFVGSEGTLGLITEATLRFTTKPKELSVFLAASKNLGHAVKILELAQKRLTLTAFEFFNDLALSHVMNHHSLPNLFAENHPFYFLIEFEKNEDDAAVLAFFDELQSNGLMTDAALSQSEKQGSEFWKYREWISESLAPHQPYKSDISVPISKIPDFVQSAEQFISRRFGGRQLVWFGHIGDGNLHFNFLKEPQESIESFSKICMELSPEFFQLVERFGGSLSAEHGIGLLKKPYLHYTKSRLEIDWMRKIKSVFDPDGILNPGKIFDLS
jgi:FAD/FMN-containing dehydrogenase